MESPTKIVCRRRRKKWRAAIPVLRDDTKIEPDQCPGDGQVAHIKMVAGQFRDGGEIGVYHKSMNKNMWLISLALVSLVIVAACTAKQEEEARKAVEEVGDKTKEVAEKAAEKTKEAVTDVAEKGKEAVSKTGEAITDGWITTKLKAKFADEKLLKGRNITAETKDRVVTLKGVVTPEGRKRAVAIANGTEGVSKVVDELILVSE